MTTRKIQNLLIAYYLENKAAKLPKRYNTHALALAQILYYSKQTNNKNHIEFATKVFDLYGEVAEVNGQLELKSFNPPRTFIGILKKVYLNSKSEYEQKQMELQSEK